MIRGSAETQSVSFPSRMPQSPPNYRLPPEWFPQEAVWLSWPVENPAHWGGDKHTLIHAKFAEIAAAILAGLESGQYWPDPENGVTGGPILEEASPGNFTVERQGDTVTIHVYDQAGRPRQVELQPNSAGT